MSHLDHILCAVSSGFPRRLCAVPDPPRKLYVRGVLPELPRAVAVVGSRAASAAAVDAAGGIARELAADGWLVVSGGAVGVDAAAHRGALAAGGRTAVVLGCGVDIAYPEQHRELFEHICACGGGLASPFAAGVPPRGGHFVRRNRVMAGLVDIVVVIEATGRSGALHTARAAREYGRALGARPGTPGCDLLLAQGAALVEDPRDAVLAAGGQGRRKRLVAPPAGSTAALVLGALDRSEPASQDQICQRTGLATRTVLSVLTRLELEGLAVGLPGRSYLRAGRFDDNTPSRHARE